MLTAGSPTFQVILAKKVGEPVGIWSVGGLATTLPTEPPTLRLRAVLQPQQPHFGREPAGVILSLCKAGLCRALAFVRV